MIFFFLIYLAVAIACLLQWGSPDHWSRVDFLSGGFLALSFLWMAETIRFNRAVGHAENIHHEASGMSYDPGMAKGITVLALGELLVFLDYGHWRLTPELAQPVLQSLGLALYAITPAWMWWADSYLGRHFSGGLTGRKIMTDGPFRYVRHPRYAGLIVSRVAFALTFASAIAWLFVLGWVLLVLRRIHLEEAQLQKLFGADYAAYAQRTARLFPGIY
jgi:protein-S-isoprenylcysteine O-methyltransferase Ste14